MVAPARERGLKSCGQCLGCRLDKGRSREGAWIEISTRPCGHKYNKGRSREGAWIEIEDIFKLGFVTIKSLPRGSVD